MWTKTGKWLSVCINAFCEAQKFCICVASPLLQLGDDRRETFSSHNLIEVAWAHAALSLAKLCFACKWL